MDEIQTKKERAKVLYEKWKNKNPERYKELMKKHNELRREKLRLAREERNKLKEEEAKAKREYYSVCRIKD